MAMEQGEKRAIHPFFCKEFGTPAKSISRPTNATNSTPSSEPAQDGAQVAGRDTTNTDWQHPGQESGLSIASLGHDPNSDRRKRRRTDQDAPGIANGTPEASEGDSTIVSSVPVYDNVEPTPTTDLHTAELQATGVQAHTAAIVDVATQLQTTNGLAPDVNGTRFSSPEKRYPERQRTLKLNPNGKLLEYPVGKQPEQPDSKRQDNKDNKRGRKAKKSDKKLVVIKYAADDSTRERLGRLIDDICNGRTKPKPQLLAPAPKPNPPPVATNQPPRATHPFFVKKPARKPNTSDPSQIAEDAQQPSSTGKSSSLDSSETSTTTFPTFRPQIPKFPEPIRPLWPPRDFVHVRGVEMDPDPQHQGASGLLNMDQRKAKDAIIRIQDTENVLLSGYGRSMNKQIPQALRIPGRYIASGQTLRKAMASQLSECSKPKPDMKVPRKALHPAVAHLDLRLATSMSAFDRGMCESCLWSQKYAPDSAEKVLQSGREAHMLRNWLRFLIITAVDTGNIPKDDESAKQKAEEKKRAKKRQKSDKLEGFIVSSEDEASEMGELSDSEEDELAGDVTVSSRRTVIRSGDLAVSSKPGTERGRMTNVVLLSGPPGSGKTASVYAVAKELDFEVFEINPGGRRNNRDIVERVGDMTRNHLVHKMDVGEGASTQPSRDASEESSQEDAKQNKLMSFFKSNVKTESKSARKGAEPEVDTKTSRSQKQSLILLEEADILFEEDRQFWSGVMTLIQHSRRPIIITCNDENLIPLHDISFHAILRYRLPPHDLAVDYLLLMAANEGHTLQRSAVSDLYNIAGSNLRKAIMDLNFWCQMGIGSNKSGLDWMLDRWPVGADLDQNGDPLRVLSLNTYQNYMGWFSRDMVLDDTPDSEIEVQEESLHWWQLSIQDSETMNSSDSQSVRAQYPATSKHEQLEKLRYESEYAEMRSALDVLCTSCPVDPKLDAVDPSAPPMPEKHRINYIEGHRLLHADLKPDYSSMGLAIGSTFEVLMGKAFRSKHNADLECTQALQVLAKLHGTHPIGTSDAHLTAAFEPMIRGDEISSFSTGRLAPSFNNGAGPLWEDLAPYIRAIVAFDLRLEQYRLKLSGLLAPSAGTKRKMRQTRASRAALEGGDKAHTRKERWFPPDTNSSRVLATGNREWQDLLVQSGHFAVGAMPEASREASRESSEPAASESSSEGGI